MAKPSQTILDQISRLKAFRDAYIELVNSSAPESDGLFARLAPRVSHDEWSRLESSVARAAGAAATAYDANGGATYSLRNAAYIMNDVNPMQNWAMSLESPEQLRPQMVVAAIDNAIGIATTRLETARRNERGLVGVIAAFLRWPSTLRAAAGTSSYQRGAAGVIGVFGQILVGAIAAALGAGLFAGVVELWRIAT